LSSYLDSSVLASLYAPDANSASALDYLRQATGPLLLTPFGEAELTNAIQLRVFQREIAAAQAQAALDTELAAAVRSTMTVKPNTTMPRMVMADGAPGDAGRIVNIVAQLLH